MRRLFSIFSLMLFVITLAGCGPIYRTQYAYVPPKSNMGKMCTAQCVQNKSVCEQMCQMRNENCRARAHEDAIYEFEAYKREQHRSGQEVKKDVNDFDRSWTCSSSCDCNSAFNACYSACGGQVLEHKECVAFCGK